MLLRRCHDHNIITLIPLANRRIYMTKKTYIHVKRDVYIYATTPLPPAKEPVVVTPSEEPAENYRALLQKNPKKETIFCKRDL